MAVCVSLGNLLTLVFLWALGIFPARPAEPAKKFQASSSTLTFDVDTTKLREALRTIKKELKSVQRPKPWSKKFAFCMECDSTERKHHSLGLCSRCYNRQYTRPSRRSK